ncbi:hypothetical protein ABWI01_12465 [Oceanicaulis alexandrii]|uniref:hypothetical protein n=1 Tax=Oceanicaulis alexandrii TaxID=153233 RepID=UPI0035CEFEE9
MSDTSETSDTKAEETLDQEAQRRREAGADGAKADRLPEPGPSEHAKTKTR